MENKNQKTLEMGTVEVPRALVELIGETSSLMLRIKAELPAVSTQAQCFSATDDALDCTCSLLATLTGVAGNYQYAKIIDTLDIYPDRVKS